MHFCIIDECNSYKRYPYARPQNVRNILALSCIDTAEVSFALWKM